MDFSSAFRFLQISPREICLLGINVDKLHYIDKCLPIYMGSSVSCSLFTIFFLSCLQRSEKDGIVHYLNNFSFVGSANSSECTWLMHQIRELCVPEDLGIPIAPKKKRQSPSNILELGINSVHVQFMFQKKSGRGYCQDLLCHWQ